jgi:nitrile hydratase subunit beta
MNGIHDLGGMHGFGPVDVDEPEPTRYEPWEYAVIAMYRSLGRVRNIDESRHAIERMDPVHYLASSYFEHWLDGMTRSLLEKGVVSKEELDERTRFFVEQPEALPAAAVRRTEPELPSYSGPRGYVREATMPPRFAPGDRVRTRVDQPLGHTRLPRYARGRQGVIAAFHGVHVFPDTNAHGLGEQPRPLYSVRFDGRELWGDSAEPNEVLYLDLWESYLEASRG